MQEPIRNEAPNITSVGPKAIVVKAVNDDLLSRALLAAEANPDKSDRRDLYTQRTLEDEANKERDPATRRRYLGLVAGIREILSKEELKTIVAFSSGRITLAHKPYHSHDDKGMRLDLTVNESGELQLEYIHEKSAMGQVPVNLHTADRQTDVEGFDFRGLHTIYGRSVTGEMLVDSLHAALEKIAARKN